MPNARIWRAFRITRLCVYVIATLLSIALAAIYAVLLIRGWTSFLAGQRAIMLVLLLIYAISAIVNYLMILIPFRIWLDGAPVAVLLIFQVGGTVTFSLFYPGFPCHNLADVSTCKRVEMAAIFGGWSLAGFLLIYAFALSAMCYVPAPSTRRLMLIEDGPLTSQHEKEVYSEKAQKRLSQTSTGSEGSVYSQSSFSVTRSPAFPSPSYKTGYPASPVDVVQVQLPPPYYRPGSPGSIHSSTHSTVSDIRESTRQRYYQSGLMPAPAPRFPPGLVAPPPPESLSRQTTTSSIRSAMSGRSGPRTGQQQPRTVQFAMPTVNEFYEYPAVSFNRAHQFDPNRMVRSPLPAWNGYNIPPGPQPQSRPLLLSPDRSAYTTSPNPGYQRRSPPPSIRGYSPPVPQQPLPDPPTLPMSFNRSVPASRPQAISISSQEQQRLIPSPLLPSLQIPVGGRQSPARVPSRAGSSSSVPRSPSPQDTSFPYGFPDRQQFAVLPAHPRLPPRTGSAMGMRPENGPGAKVMLYNPTAAGRKRDHRRSFSDSRAWTQLNNERNVAIDQWRQHAIHGSGRFSAVRNMATVSRSGFTGKPNIPPSYWGKGVFVAGLSSVVLEYYTRIPLKLTSVQVPKSKPVGPTTSGPSDGELPPPPVSSVSLYELGFGTVAGICAGVFVKKGAKMAAWFMGGIFVLLQYLRAQSFVRVDWKAIGSRFENLFHSTDAAGNKKPPTIMSLWSWLVEFLTADFQPRASFLSGFVLGLFNRLSSLKIMGRRAKNKQAAPAPIEPKESFKKLGKRKAESNDIDDEKPSARPAKKIKDSNAKSKVTKKGEGKSVKSKGKPKKEEIASDDGSEGWEDVEDDEEMQTHSR
ncbi:hypothetical protein CVT24_008923 [Panaeolus cyanescens]|uniref:Uncharacterized protein n=1 Tax=Panaeolus cyanescens TaxID=181874 RepID=A0A409VAZ8_9AGAR|nr:hypothetical protein CVT24_008923 [Panaeolus cyanescens]